MPSYDFQLAVPSSTLFFSSYTELVLESVLTFPFFLGSIVELYIVIVLVCALVRILVQVVCTNSYCAVEPISPAAPISHLNRRQMSARLSKKTLFVPCTVCPQCAHTMCMILPQCEHSCTWDDNTVCILCSVHRGILVNMEMVQNW